jgi:predicted branched-subunit amino acid permease
VVGVCIGAWMLTQPGIIGLRLVTPVVFAVVVYQAWKRV